MLMPTLHRILRVAVAGLTLAAVVAQLYDSIHRGRSVANFFSFFTRRNSRGRLVVAPAYLTDSYPRI
jgi:hypothetical protein